MIPPQVSLLANGAIYASFGSPNMYFQFLGALFWGDLSKRQQPACSGLLPLPSRASRRLFNLPCLWLAAACSNLSGPKASCLTCSGPAVACLTLSGSSIVIFNLVRVRRRIFNIVRTSGRRPAAAYSTLSGPAVTKSRLS